MQFLKGVLQSSAKKRRQTVILQDIGTDDDERDQGDDNDTDDRSACGNNSGTEYDIGNFAIVVLSISIIFVTLILSHYIM